MKRLALITGGNRGIGLGIARQLQEDGLFTVVLGSSPGERFRENLDSLGKEGRDYAYIQADIAQIGGMEELVEGIASHYGRIDVLVNNAGVAPQRRTDLLEMDEESFDRVVGINTKGTMFLTQAVARRMMGQEEIGGMRGIVVNISSFSAVVPSVNRGEYCVSKAGIAMLTKLFAARLAGERIFVYEVRPGIIKTDMTGPIKEKYDRLLLEEGLCPIRRWGMPEDVGRAVSLLCTGGLTYTTGQVLDVDGGFFNKAL